ncbi:MAG: urease accessory UreF family protein [Streptosporangiaceae bacterium]|jgi:urease accessory protein
MNARLLLLLDSRAPAGAHHHSGGMEAAVMTGLVTDLAGAEDFCRTRLLTSARVGAAFAAASCRTFINERSSVPAFLPLLDTEYEARIPAEATRRASRELGRGLWRLLRSFPWEADLATAFARCAGPAPHHPLVLGAGVALAGGDEELAARAAALAACTGPASAAVRLLGLDPFAVQAMLARLAPEVDEIAVAAAATVLAATVPPASLPADGAPALDLLADYHLTAEVRLFAS